MKRKWMVAAADMPLPIGRTNFVVHARAAGVLPFANWNI
jgi:hypothetical protein